MARIIPDGSLQNDSPTATTISVRSEYTTSQMFRYFAQHQLPYQSSSKSRMWAVLRNFPPFCDFAYGSLHLVAQVLHRILTGKLPACDSAGGV